MNISLPERMREWVEHQIDAEGYGTASEYFRALVRQEQRRKAKETLDQKLISALESGEASEMTAEDWSHIRSTVRAKFSAKSNPGK